MNLKDLTRLGAEMRVGELRVRINALATEMNAIYAAFPDLRQSKAFGYMVHGDLLSGVGCEGLGSGLMPHGPLRKRKAMTVAQRKAVGVRMKKYWAARRKASRTSSIT